MNTQGTFRYRLLTGVAACALLLAVEGTPVRADDTPNWWLTLQGQFPVWEENNDNGRRRNNLSLGEGFAIGGEFGWKFDDIHSIVTRVKINRRSNSESEYSSFGPSSFESAENTTFVADLEIGRDVGLGALGLGEGQLRAFAGVRIGHFQANSDSSYSSFGPGSGSSSQRRFTGAGPRIGFAASKPLSEQVNFDLGVAGGVLFGRQREDSQSYSSFTGYTTSSESRTAVVPNVEASAALKFLFNEDTTFSAGYKVDAYFNAIGNFGGPKSDRILHGPFVQFTIKN